MALTRLGLRRRLAVLGPLLALRLLSLLDSCAGCTCCRCSIDHLTGIHISCGTAGSCIEPEYHLRILPQCLQILDHCRGGRIPCGQIRAHGMEGDLLESQRNGRIQLTRRNRRGIDMLNGNCHGRFAVVGGLSGEHFIHHNAQRVEVGPGVHLGALCLLRERYSERNPAPPGSGCFGMNSAVQCRSPPP